MAVNDVSSPYIVRLVDSILCDDYGIPMTSKLNPGKRTGCIPLSLLSRVLEASGRLSGSACQFPFREHEAIRRSIYSRKIVYWLLENQIGPSTNRIYFESPDSVP